MEEEFDEYNDTLVWALEEEKLRTTRGQGINSFYLIVASIIILFAVFLILYFFNKGKKTSTLSMMRDPENIFDDFSEDGELMEVTEDEGDKNISEEPEIKDVLNSE
jgi:hypothetical protein